jgi:hypothetical protein
MAWLVVCCATVRPKAALKASRVDFKYNMMAGSNPPLQERNTQKELTRGKPRDVLHQTCGVSEMIGQNQT